MEIVGKIKAKFEEQIITASFKKREFVITTNEQYPQDILMEFTQDKCDLLNKYQIGQEVKVSINIRGREWINPEGVARYFNTIQAWRIENMANAAAQAPQGYDNFAPAPPVDTFSNGDDDDLPF